MDGSGRVPMQAQGRLLNRQERATVRRLMRRVSRCHHEWEFAARSPKVVVSRCRFCSCVDVRNAEDV